MQSFGKRRLRHFLRLLSLSCLGLPSMPLQAALSIGQVLEVQDGGYYTSTLTVTGLSMPSFTYAVPAWPMSVSHEWVYNPAGQNLFYALYPNAMYLGGGTSWVGIQFASWSTRAHTTSNAGFGAPIPYTGVNTFALAPDGAHIMQNGAAGLPYGGCYSNVAWVTCTGWASTYSMGFVNHWYGVHDSTPGGGSQTFWSEEFMFNGSKPSARPGVNLTRTITLKTLHLRTEDTVDFGVIPQVGSATVTAWATHPMYPTLDNVVTNTFPVGVAKFQMTEVATAACGGPEVALNGGAGAVLTDGTWYDLANLNALLGIRWVSPGTCNAGAVTTTKQFTVQYN